MTTTDPPRNDFYFSRLYTHRHLHSFLHDALPISKTSEHTPKSESFHSRHIERFKTWYAERKKWTIPASVLVFIRSEEHTSELQSPDHPVCRLLLEKKNYNVNRAPILRQRQNSVEI